VCMALHTVVSVARFCAANKILESKAPLLSAEESTGQESVRLVHVVVAVSVSGILGFSYRRIMSDATLMHYLGILVFTGLSIVYVWEEMHVLVLFEDEMNVERFDSLVVTFGLLNLRAILQKHIMYVLLHIPYYLIAVVTALTIVPQLVIWFDHPQALTFTMLVIKIKLIPLLTMYVFRSCFLQKFSVEIPIGPSHLKEKMEHGQQIKQALLPTTLFTTQRVLIGCLVIIHVAANLYVMAKTGSGSGMFSHISSNHESWQTANDTQTEL